nr:hypothetical protein [Burkholderia metallica]
MKYRACGRLGWADFPRITSRIVSLRRALNDDIHCLSSPATENLYRAGNPLVQDMVTHWGEWREGVPRR